MDTAAAPTIRVLIVEDDPRVRAAIRAFLSSAEDLELVAEAGGVAAALELARLRSPSVALVDIMLPHERDGLFLLQALTGVLRVPAVAMSFRSELCSHALTAGAYRFLDKDSSPEVLLATLRAAAARRTA